MKKTTKKSSKKKVSNDLVKTKSLFDHLKAIYEVQNPAYFDTLSEADKKTYSIYMLNRFISMNPEQVLAVNILQKYNTLDPEMHYTFLIHVIPRRKQFNAYIKPTIKESYENWIIFRVAEHFNVSKTEAMEYLDIFYSTELYQSELRKLLQMYGAGDKELSEAGL